MVLDYLSLFSLQTSTSATIRAKVPTEGPVNGCTYEISVCQLYLCMCCMCCMRLLLSPSLALLVSFNESYSASSVHYVLLIYTHDQHVHIT